MKTAVTETSIGAFYGQDLEPMEAEVLSAIRTLGVTCIADCAAYLNMERSTVAARMNSLKHFGLIVFVGRRKSERTGILSEFYRVKENKETLF